MKSTLIKTGKKVIKLAGDNQVVTAFLLVAIAAGLCVIFQSSVKSVLTTITTYLNTAVTNFTTGA